MRGDFSRSIRVKSGYTGDSMLLEASKKIKGGKMIKVELEVVKNVIKRMVISGDFFAYPPEAIEEIERSVEGHVVDDVIRIIDCYKNRVKFVGVDFNDLKELLVSIIEHFKYSDIGGNFI